MAYEDWERNGDELLHLLKDLQLAGREIRRMAETRDNVVYPPARLAPSAIAVTSTAELMQISLSTLIREVEKRLREKDEEIKRLGEDIKGLREGSGSAE
jgi:hypothetical protein